MFGLDLEHCSTYGGPLEIIAAIEQPAVIERIFTHLGLQTYPPPRVAARYDPEQEAALYHNPANAIRAVH